MSAPAPGPAPAPAPALSVRGIVVSYGGREVLRGLDLDVAAPEIVALLGPSGSGKSSLLRCIAGVQAPDGGDILWEGADLVGVPAHRRGIGLVFQDPLLFPHRDVAGNIGFALPRGPEATRRVSELLALVGLEGFEARDVATLSGGEAQRVALARALAPRPRMLLLDEPFGALDRELRDRLARDVRDLLRREGIPGLHVTHDEAEADLVADRVVRLAPGPPSP